MINKDGTVVVGVKGKSGRKTARYERIKRDAIEKAWSKVLRDMAKAHVKDVALPLALKDMTEKTDVQGNVSIEKITGMVIEGVEIEKIVDGRVEETMKEFEAKELSEPKNEPVSNEFKQQITFPTKESEEVITDK